jgi:rhodanese-related sulfurtransferase
MTQAISPATLHAWLQDGSELALFDVREAGLFGEGHLFFAVPLPYSRLELDVARLAPRLAVRIVLVDGGDGLAQQAARRLEDVGYSRVALLAGGTPAWEEAGHVLFKGVNVPSKTFGELAEHAYATPHLSAAQLEALRTSGKRIVILDGRTVEEHHKMTIPGATSCPNGELAARLRAIVPDDETTIVVNCAGRTRSIIGAQTLRNLGIPNPVYALENGTQGWTLNDLVLEHHSQRRYQAALPPDLGAERIAATGLLAQFGIPTLTARQAQQWIDDPLRTTYVLDIRSAEEFAAATLAGARHAPGGQLIQATDQYVGVRNSRLLLLDNEAVRAPVVASWMHQLGFEVGVVEGGIQADLQVAAASAPSCRAVATVTERELRQWREAGRPCALVDLRSSAAYRERHAEGAVWAVRPNVVARLDRAGQARERVVLIADRKEEASLVALDLREAGVGQIEIAADGLATIEAAGIAMVSTPTEPPDDERIDFLFFVHDRHEGNREAARRYLAWETGLIAQCRDGELAGFRLPARSGEAATSPVSLPRRPFPII